MGNTLPNFINIIKNTTVFSEREKNIILNNFEVFQSSKTVMVCDIFKNVYDIHFNVSKIIKDCVGDKISISDPFFVLYDYNNGRYEDNIQTNSYTFVFLILKNYGNPSEFQYHDKNNLFYLLDHQIFFLQLV